MKDAEEECITHGDAYDTELEVKDTKDTPEAEQEKIAQREGNKALRILLDDFEAQIQWQNEVEEESSSDSQEEFSLEGLAAEPLTNFAGLLSPQEI